MLLPQVLKKSIKTRHSKSFAIFAFRKKNTRERPSMAKKRYDTRRSTILHKTNKL
jgi:hypothetical protein